MEQQHIPGPVVRWRGFDKDEHVVSECIGKPAQVRTDAHRLKDANRTLKEALRELLSATVDDDLAHGIALTEREQAAREMALEALADDPDS